LSNQSENSEKRQLGPFRLEDRLGAGGMGIVYRATYLKTGQTVAVKVLAPDLTADPKIAKRFEREMSILKKLQHNLLYANGQAVRLVMTDGRPQVLEGVFVAEDPDRIVSEGGRVARMIWSRLEQEGWFT
jgi:serine/threonine protein kinase